MGKLPDLASIYVILAVLNCSDDRAISIFHRWVFYFGRVLKWAAVRFRLLTVLLPMVALNLHTQDSNRAYLLLHTQAVTHTSTAICA